MGGTERRFAEKEADAVHGHRPVGHFCDRWFAEILQNRSARMILQMLPRLAFSETIIFPLPSPK